MTDFALASASPPSAGRRPRGMVTLDGSPVSFLSFEVTQKSFFSAATFSVELECWDQPEGHGLSWWDTAGVTPIEILMGTIGPADPADAFPDDPVSLLVGQVDNVAADALTGSLTVTGRDLTALFIDTKTTVTYPDQTSSQIAEALAAEHDLSAIITSTSTPVGSYVDSHYAQLTRAVPEWDLLTFLAQREGFDTYMMGQTLYFGPPQADSDSDPYQIAVAVAAAEQSSRIQASATSLKLNRALTLAQDIAVTVISSNPYTGTVQATAKRGGTGAIQTTSAKNYQSLQNYLYLLPGLDQNQANQEAATRLEDISRHERTVEATVAGDQNLSPRRRLQISGTGTGWDQSYYLDQVVHRFGFKSGYQTSMHGKNHTTETELAAP